MGRVYSGIVGQYVLPSIRTAAKSLDIVSPYLSPEYARLLTSRAEQGITVRLITSDVSSQRHQQALKMLRQQAGLYILGSRFWSSVVLALGLGLLGVMIGNYPGLVLIVFAGVVCVATFARNLTRNKTSNIPLYVKVVPAAQLVHVKLYVVDQQVALVGSANLTYYGMNRNIERIEIKTSPSEVQPETVVFARLWGSQQAPAMPPATPQAQSVPTDDTVLTREEAETLDKLYGKKKPP